MNRDLKLWETYLKAKNVSEIKPFKLDQIAFEQQLKFINDETRLKALFCTRRAAKSYTGGVYLLDTALNFPGSNCLFIGLTRQSAHGIIWKDILRELDLKYKLNIKFNESLLTATLPNGSVIWVTGADTDENEMNKLLGKKYKLVVLDEASMFSINMYQLVYGVLKPATADHRGTICVLGTASNITRGLFYDITTGKEPGWSLHQWTAYDNPHVKKQWEEEIADIQANRPLFMQTALFRQWYLNEWVISEEALVYKFNRERNSIQALPVMDIPYRYILGIDLGHFPDPSAFTIAAYSESSPFLFIIHSEKHLKMDVTDVSNRVKELDKIYSFDAKIIDGSMKMAIAEMNSRHGVNVIPAEKSGKEHWINIVNSELIQGRIKLLPSAAPLVEELETLVWVTDNGMIVVPRKEHPNLANHAADSFLYLLRYTYNYLHSKPDNGPDWGSQEHWEKPHIESLERQVQIEKNPNHWDTVFSPAEDLFDFESDDGI